MPFISCKFLNNKIHYTKNPHTFLHSLWADRANFNKALQSSWWRSSRMEPRHGLQMPSSSDQLDFFRKMYSFSSRRMLAKTAGMRAGGSFGQPSQRMQRMQRMLPAKATCGAGGSFGQPLKERSEKLLASVRFRMDSWNAESLGHL